MSLFRVLKAVLLASVVSSSPALAQTQTPPATASPPTATAPPATAPASPPPAAAPATPPAGACFPSCRTGFLCMQGQCISACNPPCAASEQCTAAGQCERIPVAAAAPMAVSPATNPAVAPAVDQGAGSRGPADPGWARGAGVYGIVAAVGTIALTAASEATKEDQVPALPLGAGATVLIAVSGPVTAVGAASARDGGGVKGAPGARIAGWIGYGLTLLDASILIGMGANEVEPVDGLILSVGLLGAASLACFSTDAFISASQAEAAAGSPPPPQGFDFSVSPALGFRRTKDGAFEPTLGVTGAF